jgi:hypothetical protein
MPGERRYICRLAGSLFATVNAFIKAFKPMRSNAFERGRPNTFIEPAYGLLTLRVINPTTSHVYTHCQRLGISLAKKKKNKIGRDRNKYLRDIVNIYATRSAIVGANMRSRGVCSHCTQLVFNFIANE